MSALSGPEEDPAGPSCSVERPPPEGGSSGDGDHQEATTASTSGRSELTAEPGAKTPCAFYMRTGTCAYGDRCKFLHPEDRPTVYSNSRGLPLRPAEPECTFYLRNGWCAFAETCKYHHPELPPGAPMSPAGQQRPAAAAGPSQHQHDQQQQHRPRRNGTTGRHQQQHPQHAGQHQHPPGSSGSQQQQHHQYHVGPYAFYLPTPYHPGMASPPGQGLLMHYGFYPHPGMSPPNGASSNGRGAYPVVTSAMIHPVMHLRPYGSGPVQLPPVVQRGTLQRSSSGGPQGSGSHGYRPGRAYSLDRAGQPGAGVGPSGRANNNSSGQGGGRGPRGGANCSGCSAEPSGRRSKSPAAAAAGGGGGFGPMGPSPEAKAAAAAAVAAATAAPMPRPSSASPTRQERSAAAQEEAGAPVVQAGQETADS